MPITLTCEICGREFSRKPSLVGRFCGYACRNVETGRRKRVDPLKYFWAHIQKTDGCWLWIGERAVGYGQLPRTFRERGAFDGEIKAHRVHRCDNPPCVNPSHLFLGTPKDNAVDRTRKGRGNPPVGTRACGARFTSEIIQAIRASYARGTISMKALGREYGVLSGHIEQIVNRKIWRSVQ